MAYIEISPAPARVRVMFAGQTIAESSKALALREGGREPVLYLPRNHVRLELIERTTHSSYCPHKGTASYFTIVVDGQRAENAIWSYEHPVKNEVASIADHLAFYPSLVDAIVIN